MAVLEEEGKHRTATSIWPRRGNGAWRWGERLAAIIEAAGLGVAYRGKPKLREVPPMRGSITAICRRFALCAGLCAQGLDRRLTFLCVISAADRAHGEGYRRFRHRQKPVRSRFRRQRRPLAAIFACNRVPERNLACPHCAAGALLKSRAPSRAETASRAAGAGPFTSEPSMHMRRRRHGVAIEVVIFGLNRLLNHVTPPELNSGSAIRPKMVQICG